MVPHCHGEGALDAGGGAEKRYIVDCIHRALECRWLSNHAENMLANCPVPGLEALVVAEIVS